MNKTLKILSIGLISIIFSSCFVFAQGVTKDPKDTLKMFEKEQPISILEILEQEIIKAPETPTPVQEKKLTLDQSALQQQKILIKKFKIEGNTIISQDSLNKILSPFENKELTMDLLKRIAELITTKYRELGYEFSYAFIPVQSMADGTVIIKVFEGKVGNIIIKNNKYYDTDFIKQYLESTKKYPALKESALERKVLLLKEISFLKDVIITLARGETPGTMDIVMDVNDKSPLSLTLMFDNMGIKFLSKTRATVGFEFGSFLRMGDTIQVSILQGTDKLDLENLGVNKFNYSLPIGSDGFKIGGTYSYSLYEYSATTINYNGQSYTTLLYGEYPIIKQRKSELNVTGGLTYQNFYGYVGTFINQEEKTRDINIGINYKFIDRHLGSNLGRNSIGITFYHGLGNSLGGSSLSPQFNLSSNKISFDIERIQGIGKYNFLLIKTLGQYTNENFVGRFSIGGPQSVRGFDTAYATGDKGYSLTTEFLAAPLPSKKRLFGYEKGQLFKVAAFTDIGVIYRNKLKVDETLSKINIGSIGIGFRVYAGEFYFKFDYAIPYNNADAKFSTKDAKAYFFSAYTF